ncbi:AI-2 transport protein TqsA [Stieleria maiorica]|uniref:AI-2 transport protein TqsA n=1 Tax=Stieleria maiorica TaxID=2795974 RepID=A0A5B9MEM8_9BACT|nr:AI-2E family transporter [Stieleria maiorica]QEF99273.1 AI-2 transport protein TqsA [Stieleria maiorica]
MAKPHSNLATLTAVAQWLAVVTAVATLYLAKDVFIPLALGILLSFLLSPLVNRLQRLGVPNVMAVVATALLAFAVLGGVFTLLGRELTNLVGELPQYKHELVHKARGVAGLTDGMGGSLDDLAEEVSEAIEEGSEAESESPPESRNVIQSWTDRLLPAQLAKPEKTHDGKTAKSPLYVTEVQGELPLATWATTAGTVLGPLATAGLVTVFALFILIHREDLRDRIIAVVSQGDYVTTTEILDEAAQRISRYLLAQTVINTGYGVVLTLGLTAIGTLMTVDGFPNAVLWGVMATCLRFVPYVGPTAAAIFPSVIALAVFPGYSVFLSVVALITVMELICNNIIEPWLYGTSTGISAIAVILAAVFWGWLWGPVGLLLSTPLTVCFVVLGRYVPRFGMLSTLLGEEVAIQPSMRIYQRLLAGDEYRAREILRTHVAEEGIANTADRVIVPALKRIRIDQDAERLADSDAERLFALAGGLIADLQNDLVPTDTQVSESEPTSHCETSQDQYPTVIGCTSHHFSETLLLNLLRVTGRECFNLHAIDDETLPLEVGQEIATAQPTVIVIFVLPPGGFAQGRYLCTSIREAGFNGPIIVACMGKFKNYDKLFVRFRKAGATSMTTSFSQTHNKIESLLQRRDRIASTQPAKPAVDHYSLTEKP